MKTKNHKFSSSSSQNVVKPLDLFKIKGSPVSPPHSPSQQRVQIVKASPIKSGSPVGSLPRSPPNSDPLEEESPSKSNQKIVYTKPNVSFRTQLLEVMDEQVLKPVQVEPIQSKRIVLPDPYAFDDDSDEEDKSCARTAGIQRTEPVSPLKRKLEQPETPPAKKPTVQSANRAYTHAAFAKSLKENQPMTPRQTTPIRRPTSAPIPTVRSETTVTPVKPKPVAKPKSAMREYRTVVLKRQYVLARTNAAKRGKKSPNKSPKPSPKKSPAKLRRSPRHSPVTSPRKSPRNSPQKRDIWNTSRWKPLEKPIPRRVSISSLGSSPYTSDMSSELDYELPIAIDLLSTARESLLEELNEKICGCKPGLRRKKLEAQRKLLLEGVPPSPKAF